MVEADFWAPRNCFVTPIPELAQAAALLEQGVEMLLIDNVTEARRLILEADINALYPFADMIERQQQPSIIRFRKISGSPASLDKQDRASPWSSDSPAGNAVFRRDFWRCRYCGCRVVPAAVRKHISQILPGSIRWGKSGCECHAGFRALWGTIDHVLPHSRGGTNDPENLVTACFVCQFGRMEKTLAEVGLKDPRDRDPVEDAWDGLTRILPYKRRDPLVVQGPLVPPGQSKIVVKKPLMPEGLKKFSMTTDGCFTGAGSAHPQISTDLEMFLKRSQTFDVSWSKKEILLVRLSVNNLHLNIFGIRPNGDVEIPWSIPVEKEKFRVFAQTLANKIPGTEAYESAKLWNVRRIGRKANVHISEILEHADSVLVAIQSLKERLMA